MADEYELLLKPKLASVTGAIDGELRGQIKALADSINNSNLLKLEVSIDVSKMKDIEKQLLSLGKSFNTARLSEFKEPIVSTRAISAVTAEKLKQKLANEQLMASEKQRSASVQNSAKAEIASSRLRVQLKKEEAQASKVAESVSKSSAANQSLISTEKLSQGIKKLNSDIEVTKNNWSKMLGDPKAMSQISTMQDDLIKLGKSLSDAGGDPVKLKEIQSQLGQLKGNFGLIKNEARIAGDDVKSFGDRVKETFSRLSSYMLNVLAFQAVLGNIRNAVQAVKDIDLSMTELKKVTNETGARYNQFLDDAAVRAQKLGASISDVVTASADFARLGYSISESEKLADSAIIYQNVGDFENGLPAQQCA